MANGTKAADVAVDWEVVRGSVNTICALVLSRSFDYDIGSSALQQTTTCLPRSH